MVNIRDTFPNGLLKGAASKGEIPMDEAFFPRRDSTYLLRSLISGISHI